MAQFLLAIYHAPEQYSAASEFGAYRDEAEMRAAYEATGAFNKRLMDEGSWVFACGLTPPEATVTVDGRPDEPTFSEGPAAPAEEYLGGFWIVEVADLDAAVALAADGSRACGQRVQVRALQGT